MRRSCDTLSADSEQGNCFVTAITAPMRELHTPVEDFEKERSYFTMIEGKGFFFFFNSWLFPRPLLHIEWDHEVSKQETGFG